MPSAESPTKASQSGIDFGIGIRVVYGTKVLYGYTNKTDADELRRIVSELAAKDLRDPVTTTTAFDFMSRGDIHNARDTLTAGASVESKVAFLLKADQAARAASNMITQTRGGCMQREQAVEIFNSEGLHTQDVRN